MNTPNSIVAFALAAFVSVSLGCNAPGSTGTENQVTTTGESEPRDRSMNDKIQNARKLHLGDSPEHVIAIMGAPRYDQVMMKKERQQVIGRNLTYLPVMRFGQSWPLIGGTGAGLELA